MVSLHKIPNLALGKAGPRHVTRMVFPRLYEEGSQDRTIPAHTLARIYDQGIRPAVEAICDARLSHWPPSYSAAITKARDIHGKLHFGTIDLPPNLLPQFTERLRVNLNGMANLKLNDMYFMHEVRGTKGFTVHDPDDILERWNTLEEELDFLDTTSISPRNWYIDVGLEVYLKNHVVQWLEDAHLRLLHFGLPKQSEEDPDSLSRLLIDKRNFLTDRVAQLKEFAGFRSKTGSKGLSDKVGYLNVYTTDKEPTYQLHNGSFRIHHASELLPFTGDKLLKDVSAISNVYGQCMGTEERSPNEGCARFELRILLSESADALAMMPPELLRSALVAIPADLWW